MLGGIGTRDVVVRVGLGLDFLHGGNKPVRFGRRRRAVFVAIAVFVSIVLVVFSPDLPSATRGSVRVLVAEWGFVSFVAVCAAASAHATSIVIHKYWRIGESDWEKVVFNSGVRGFGSLSCLCFFLYGVLRFVDFAAPLGTTLWVLALAFLVSTLVVLPVCLLWGYTWGAGMAKFMGLSPPNSTSKE